MSKAKTPKPASALPPAPDHLGAGAKEVWARTVALLARMTKFTTGENVLTTADLDKLELYCVAFSRWQEAERHVTADGQVIKLPSGYHGPNPFVAIANTAARQARQLGEDFGLSPGSRARMGICFNEGSVE
jgi:P27 family predicted phage terminase small subunit